MAIVSKDVADNIRKQAKVFQAIIDAADAFEKISSIENAADEAQARLDAVRVDERAATLSVDSLKDEIKSYTSKKAEHLVRIDAMLEDANKQAGGIIADAKATASGVVDAAKAQASDIVAAANSEAGLSWALVDDAKAELARITAAIADAKKEHASAQKAIDALKAKFS